MTIKVNSESYQIQEDFSLFDLLESINFQSGKGYAIAVNNEIISKSNWSTIKLKESDFVLIINATQGG